MPNYQLQKRFEKCPVNFCLNCLCLIINYKICTIESLGLVTGYINYVMILKLFQTKPIFLSMHISLSKAFVFRIIEKIARKTLKSRIQTHKVSYVRLK